MIGKFRNGREKKIFQQDIPFTYSGNIPEKIIAEQVAHLSLPFSA
jgi:hypothetical protein